MFEFFRRRQDEELENKDCAKDQGTIWSPDYQLAHVMARAYEPILPEPTDMLLLELGVFPEHEATTEGNQAAEPSASTSIATPFDGGSFGGEGGFGAFGGSFGDFGGF